MSILSKLGKKLGLSGSDKKDTGESVERDVFNLNREPDPEPIAEAVPASERIEAASANASETTTVTQEEELPTLGPRPDGPSANFAPRAAPVAAPPIEAPLSGDALLLAKMVQQGANLRQPRHAMFFLYFPTEQAAQMAQNALGYHPMSQACGFQVTVDLTPSAAGWLCLLQLDLIINELSLKHVRRDLEALAAQLNGTFDGWEASLQAA